jgi:muramoyltetrapeptide carboxypeptidase
MLKPRRLQTGDRIGIVAPASPFEGEEFEKGLAELRRLGFAPVFDETVFARDSYVAGDAETRARAIQGAWEDPSIAGLIAVRGGYGSVQVLPLLDAQEARRTPKIFVGYSDLTSLLTWLTINCGVVAFHGPMLADKLGRGPAAYDHDSFMQILTSPEPFGEMAPPGLERLRPGEAAGPLFGGTLTQLLASLATPYAFDPPSGYVLFIDEVGERPYRLDRMLMQLRLSGLLGRASAVVVGELPRCDEAGGSPQARETVARLLADFSGPVLFGFPSGHTRSPAFTLPLGVRTRVIAGPRPRLVIEEPAVD